MTADEVAMFESQEEEYSKAKITAIGIGSLGSQLANFLKPNLADIECLETVFGSSQTEPDNISELFSAIRDSDLVFLLAGFSEPQRYPLLLDFSQASQDATVLSVGIFPTVSPLDTSSQNFITAISKFINCTITTSSQALTDKGTLINAENRDFFDQFVMCQAVSLITEVIQRDDMICVDYADVKSVLDNNTLGKLGIGTIVGTNLGKVAAELAIDRLNDQGVDLCKTKGILTCIYGSSLTTMENFDEAATVIYEHCGEDCKIICSFTEGAMGDSVKVSVLALM